MIGEKIRTIRTAKGYSQDYVANLLNIKQPAYSDIETDKTKLNFARAQEIANILEIDVSEILPFDSNQVFNNTFNQDAKGFFNIKKFFNESFKEERQSYQEQIKTLKDEVTYLRKKLDEK